jgi:hypothetical protein
MFMAFAVGEDELIFSVFAFCKDIVSVRIPYRIYAVVGDRRSCRDIGIEDVVHCEGGAFFAATKAVEIVGQELRAVEIREEAACAQIISAEIRRPVIP